jgi:hypothetical protein
MNSKANQSLNHRRLLKAFITLFFAGLPFAARSDHIDPKGDRVWEQKPGGTQKPENAKGSFLGQDQTLLPAWALTRGDEATIFL